VASSRTLSVLQLSSSVCVFEKTLGIGASQWLTNMPWICYSIAQRPVGDTPHNGGVSGRTVLGHAYLWNTAAEDQGAPSAADVKLPSAATATTASSTATALTAPRVRDSAATAAAASATITALAGAGVRAFASARA